MNPRSSKMSSVCFLVGENSKWQTDFLYFFCVDFNADGQAPDGSVIVAVNVVLN